MNKSDSDLIKGAVAGLDGWICLFLLNHTGKYSWIFASLAIVFFMLSTYFYLKSLNQKLKRNR